MVGFDYQLRDVDDLYIAGGASHGPDFRKSAGGFLHGFRYTGENIGAVRTTHKLHHDEHNEYKCILKLCNVKVAPTSIIKWTLTVLVYVPWDPLGLQGK